MKMRMIVNAETDGVIPDDVFKQLVNTVGEMTEEALANVPGISVKGVFFLVEEEDEGKEGA